MIRRLLLLAACGTLAPCPPASAAAAAATTACTRASLQSAVDRYLASQGMGDPDSLPLAPKARYTEQRQPADLRKGILTQVLKVDFHHTLLDVKQCETFTELGITDAAHPYVIGTQLEVDDDLITAINSLLTRTNDWQFDAGGFVKYALQEDWAVLPREHRSNRDTLLAAANAYLDHLGDPAVQVPWGTPCRRLEGGRPTGTGSPDDRCDAGLPQGIAVTDRHFLVDEAYGAVAGLVSLGSNQLPGTYLFQIVDGRIHGIHTLALCREGGCGLPAPARADKP